MNTLLVFQIYYVNACYEHIEEDAKDPIYNKV
jgi:hypothetical protein